VNEQNDGDELCNYRTEFKKSYFKAVATINKKIQYEKNSIRTSSQQGNCLKEESSKKEACKATPFIKLQSLNIHILLDSYTEWTSFYDILYTSLVHNNENLSAIQTFFYLRCGKCVADCLKNIETTWDNYEIAWTNLITRYNNKKLLVQTQVKAIYDLPTIKSKSINHVSIMFHLKKLIIIKNFKFSSSIFLSMCRRTVGIALVLMSLIYFIHFII